MANAKKGIEHWILVVIAVSLFSLLAWMAVTRSLGEKAEDAMNAGIDLGKNLGVCKSIGSVDESGFLKEVDKVYGTCDTEKRCKWTSCETATASKDIDVTGSDLKNAGMNYLFGVGNRPSIACDINCGAVSPTVYMAYPDGTKAGDLTVLCRGRYNGIQGITNMCAQPEDSYFRIKQGSKVRIMAEFVDNMLGSDYTLIKLEVM